MCKMLLQRLSECKHKTNAQNCMPRIFTALQTTKKQQRASVKNTHKDKNPVLKLKSGMFNPFLTYHRQKLL
jgi:hypothetical protein